MNADLSPLSPPEIKTRSIIIIDRAGVGSLLSPGRHVGCAEFLLQLRVPLQNSSPLQAKVPLRSIQSRLQIRVSLHEVVPWQNTPESHDTEGLYASDSCAVRFPEHAKGPLRSKIFAEGMDT